MFDPAELACMRKESPMARMKASPELVRVKIDLAERLVSLRRDFFGTRGGPAIARSLNVTSRTWYNYERGMTIPAEILLKLIETFAVEPSWLLHGEGPRFRGSQTELNENPTAGTTSRQTAILLLRLAVELLEKAKAAGSRPDERRWGHAIIRGE